MAAFYKMISSDCEGSQVILMYVLLTIGNTDKISHNMLIQMVRAHTHTLTHTHTHTHNFPLEILIRVPQKLNIFEHITFFITRIISAFSTKDSEAL
jgi:hypothetical protein